MSNEKERILQTVVNKDFKGANPTVSEMIAPEHRKDRLGMLTGFWWSNHIANKRLEDWEAKWRIILE